MTRTFENIYGSDMEDILSFYATPVLFQGTSAIETDLHNPEVIYMLEDGGLDLGPWNALSGYSGQYRYNGPIMDSSEYISEGMGEDLLAVLQGKTACVVEVQAWSDHFQEYDECGWAIIYQ